jgi:hypothetical protein
VTPSSKDGPFEWSAASAVRTDISVLDMLRRRLLALSNS